LGAKPAKRFLPGRRPDPRRLAEPLPVGISYGPLFSANDALLNVIASVRDITRFRTAEEMKSSFISVVSHELKTLSH
jgi:signal transduction histidine kinase